MIDLEICQNPINVINTLLIKNCLRDCASEGSIARNFKFVKFLNLVSYGIKKRLCFFSMLMKERQCARQTMMVLPPFIGDSTLPPMSRKRAKMKRRGGFWRQQGRKKLLSSPSSLVDVIVYHHLLPSIFYHTIVKENHYCNNGQAH